MSTTSQITSPRLLLMSAGVGILLLGSLLLLGQGVHAAGGNPVISTVLSTPTDTGATITWNTDDPSSSQVLYGPGNGDYNASSTLDNTSVTSHTAFLGGLTPNTTYHFIVMSMGSTTATSSDMTFMTASTTATSTATSTGSTGTTTNTMATSTGPITVMLMKHLCNASIQSVQDFDNLGTGKDPVATLAADVLACPTTGLVGNAAVANTVASARSTYDFTVQSNGAMQTMSANGTFAPHELCESDINKDVNGDGTVSSSTCLDISHYMVMVNASGTPITVTESMQPAGYHFGTLRFTPPALDGNNDADSLTNLDSQNGVITLNPTVDKDSMIMLHVYDFANVASTTGSTTPPTGTGSTTLDMLQAEITALQARVSALEAFIAGFGGNTGTSTPSTGGTGSVDQSNVTVAAGGSIDLSGRNFGREETVNVTLNGAQVATAHADGGGNFSTGSFQVPSTAGTYTYVLKGATSGISANATVTVQ